MQDGRGGRSTLESSQGVSGQLDPLSCLERTLFLMIGIVMFVLLMFTDSAYSRKFIN